ncbi:MAG: Uma2 family endonuclease [Gammaproteobacteria bacterium]|nr:Uma2 family endonuclease [Gammaproteobacteria bacterium]
MNEQIETEAGQEMGSVNHSFVQGRIIVLLSTDDRFKVFVELSLDTGQTDLSQFGLKAKDELKPDVSVYPKGRLTPNKMLDVIRTSDAPLLAVEVLSPKQGIEDILTKFKAYFALGVKSCWLIVPALEAISVYSQNGDTLFSIKDAELVDEVADIRLPIRKVFEW